MAGGIYTSRPFEPNLKCIVFASVLMLGYWFASCKPNKYLLPLIFIIAYVSMAWYDVMYNCDNIMNSGNDFNITSIFKNQLQEKEKDSSVLNQKEIYQKNIYLFHLFIVAPLLGYIGYNGYKGKLKAKSKIFVVLMVIASGTMLYHGGRMFNPRKTL